MLTIGRPGLWLASAILPPHQGDISWLQNVFKSESENIYQIKSQHVHFHQMLMDSVQNM